MKILELKDVSYAYKNKYQSVRAVKDVSFGFEEGSVYAIVGKSGSGKTTLLSILSGLDLPGDGEVLYAGKATAKLDRDRYRRESVSVIYQGYNLFPLLTVMENVTYPMELTGVKLSEAKKRAVSMLEVVGLTETVFRRYPSMLSGGEQQRVAIARALCTNARVILADEPTGNLDVENSKNIVSMLAQLAHKRGYCVIIVTHDLAIAELADVVLRMRDGELSVEKVNDRPAEGTD